MESVKSSLISQANKRRPRWRARFPSARERLSLLMPDEREELGWRLRRFRSMRRETWVTMLDGGTHGPLIIRTERPGT